MRKLTFALLLTAGLALPALVQAAPLSLAAGEQPAVNLIDQVRHRLVCRERCGPYGCREVCFRPSHGYDDGFYGYRRPYGYGRPYGYDRPYGYGWRYGYDRPYGYRRRYYGLQEPNCYPQGCCPPGYTIQHGRCEPYRGR